MLAVVNIATEEAYKMVNVPAMKKFLLSMKNNYSFAKAGAKSGWELIDPATGQNITPKGCSDVNSSLPGGLMMHANGEIDMRGVYCSLVIADILNLIDGNTDLTRGMGDFIASCQTYEGGITCIPFGEAHGGYTFCGLGAMIILGEWLCNR